MSLSSQQDTDGGSLPKNVRVQAEGTAETEEDDPTITTIDLSTLHQIPNHLSRIIQSVRKTPTQIDLIIALAVGIGLECGFVGDWCCEDDEVLASYQLNWSYSFDQNLLTDFASFPAQNSDSDDRLLRLKFSLAPLYSIGVNVMDSGDLAIVSAFLVGKDRAKKTVTLALSISRYIATKRFNSKNLAANFRNLRELSVTLKDKIYFPLKNNICALVPAKSAYPSLQGIGEVIFEIRRYLKGKDLDSLSTALL